MTLETAEINREHKDRLFIFLFGEKGHKEWTLSLYNAVNGTDHTDPNSIEFHDYGGHRVYGDEK